MIYTAYYYSGSLDKGDLIVRDNRFYPGKYFETFPVWLQYVRKHHPNDDIIMYADALSPIPIEEALKYIDESYSLQEYEEAGQELKYDVKLHIFKVSEHTGKYFWAMQRNLVYGLIDAFQRGEDFFWLDNDAFLNSDFLKISRNFDVVAPQINHQQFTCDSVCTFVSAKRLLEIKNLPEYLLNMLNNGPTETRMHSLQEGGLYKMFCYGKVKSANKVNLSHLSCYKNFQIFLERNPLNTQEYKDLLYNINNFDFSKIPGVDLEFHDMYYEEV